MYYNSLLKKQLDKYLIVPFYSFSYPQFFRTPHPKYVWHASLATLVMLNPLFLEASMQRWPESRAQSMASSYETADYLKNSGSFVKSLSKPLRSPTMMNCLEIRFSRYERSIISFRTQKLCLLHLSKTIIRPTKSIIF